MRSFAAFLFASSSAQSGYVSLTKSSRRPSGLHFGRRAPSLREVDLKFQRDQSVVLTIDSLTGRLPRGAVGSPTRPAGGYL